jgi:predicted TIM-barrel fold metal-dependent hydrolase
VNIDLHFHHTPRFFLEELSGANPWGKSVHGSGDALVMRVGALEIPLSPEHWDVKRTLAVMDARSIDVAAISPEPAALPHTVASRAGGRLHRRVNDRLAELAHKHSRPLCATPGRCRPGRRARGGRARAMHGARSSPASRSRRTLQVETWTIPSLRPLFAAAERLGAVIFLHPLAVLGADCLAAHYLINLIGNPTDTAVAAASLIFGGVLRSSQNRRSCAPTAADRRRTCAGDGIAARAFAPSSPT